MDTEYTWDVWDCSDCGKTGISGKYKECPRCKSPQDSTLTPEENWYRPANPEKITDADELRRAKAGPAWNCGNCQTLNDGDTTKCSRCGQALDFDDVVNREVVYDNVTHYDDAPDVEAERLEDDLSRGERALATNASEPRRKKRVTRRASDLPTKGRDTDFYNDIREQVDADYTERDRVSALPPALQFLHKNKRAAVIGSAIVAVLVIIGLTIGGIQWYQYETATEPGTVTIAQLNWERKVEVEEYKTLNQADWDHPGDARVQNSERKIRTYRTVHDRWETQWYDDQETRYKTENYTDTETRYKSESYTDSCSRTRTVSNGNGSSRTETEYYSCSKTRQVPYTVTVNKTRQVPYYVTVRKSRQIEITHQEPVWDTWYTYQIDRWQTDRWVVVSEADNPKPYWPESIQLDRNNQPGDQVGEERVGEDRFQLYEIIYTDAKGNTHVEKSEGDGLWSKLEKGETVGAQYYQKNGELKDGSVDWKSVS